MRISTIGIYNLRSIEKLELKLGSNFDVLVGQNDSGKSTILYALKKFLTGDATKDKFEFGSQTGERSDLSLFSGTHKILDTNQEIGAEEIGVLLQFVLTDSDIIAAGDLSGAISDKKLTILRKDPANGKPSYSVLTKEFTDSDFQGLANKSASDLKNLMDRHPDSNAFATNENAKGTLKKEERVLALAAYAEQIGMEKETMFTPIKEITAYDFWPEYLPLESHGKIDGSDKIIEKALDGISQKEIEAFKKQPGYSEFLNRLTAEFVKASQIIQTKAQKLIPSISSFRAVPKSEITTKKEYLMERYGLGKETHFDNQGDGTKRRLMVAILQAAREIERDLIASRPAEEEETENTKPYEKLVIWGLDEPELHLHPGAQRDFFFSLRDFAEGPESSYQILCSTHSTVFVDHVSLDSMHIVELDTSKTKVHTASVSGGGVSGITKTLGVRNSDLFFANGFIVVEGATEFAALPILFQSHFERSMDDYGIRIINAHSCSNIPDKFKILFENFGNSVALLDKDSEDSTKTQIPEGRRVYIGKQDFEDAFDNDVWVAVLSEMAPETEWSAQGIENEIKAKLGEETNKKFLRLIDSHRKKTLTNDERDGLAPLSEHKPEVGEKIAFKAAELGKIPPDIVTLFNIVRSLLVPNSQ